VLNATIAGLAATLYVGIPVDIWDALWSIYSPNGEQMRVAFRDIYGLSIVTIMVGDPPVPVDVVQAEDVVTYAAWFVFSLSDEAVCSEGCEQSRLPE